MADKEEKIVLGEEERKLEKLFRDYAANVGVEVQPNRQHLDRILVSVVKNEKEQGGRFCPCRLRKQEYDYDVSLLCPCNYRIQNTWRERRDCWCGLFLKPKSKE